MIKAAVVQHPPVFLDLGASLERAAALVAEAAAGGASLVVFPEAWFPGYPTWVWRLRPGEDMAVCADMHALLARNAVNVGAGGLTPLQEIARGHGVVLVAGFNEIDARTSGSTLFNSAAVIDADGRIANHHRKLMPTNPERMVWGFGDGSTLRVVDTAVGRIGTLLCWENYMPLARYALYAQRVEIYVAPTWDTGDSWLATMRHIAREAGAWVIGCSTPMQAADVPADLPHRDKLFPDPDEWINDGDARGAPPLRAGGGRADAPREGAAVRRYRHRRRRRRAPQLRRGRALRPPRRLHPDRQPHPATPGRLRRRRLRTEEAAP